jgi:phosphatidylinositol glycan class Q protein
MSSIHASALILSQSVPLPLSQTFSQYAQLGHRLRKHYLSPSVFLCLVSGQFVPPIHRKSLYSLQYSMLPVQRVSIGQLWKLLTEDRKPEGVVVGNGHVAAASMNGKRRKGRNISGG